MVNYSDSKIYQIRDKTTLAIYIGSTTRTLNNRLKNHKSGYKRYLSGKERLCASYNIIKDNNYTIELIEDFPCKTKKELLTREQHFIDTMDCINTNNSILTKERRVEKLRQNRLDKLQYRRDKDNNRYKLIKTWGDSVTNLYFIDDTLFC